MFFFNFKKKTNNFNGGMSLKDLKKQAKRSDALILPIEEGKKATKFYKIGNDVYAPVPTQNQKKPVFFKVTDLTFVSQEDTNGKAENRYNISIQYKKNFSNYFYSYDLCDDKIKNNLVLNLAGAVKIQTRNKEDLYKNQSAQVQPKQVQLSEQELDKLFFEDVKVDETRREFLTKSPKHIDTTKRLSDEEFRNFLREYAKKARQERANQIQQGNVITTSKVESNTGRIKINEKVEPSRYEIPPKKFFQKIKFAPEIVADEGKNKIDDIEFLQ